MLLSRWDIFHHQMAGTMLIIMSSFPFFNQTNKMGQKQKKGSKTRLKKAMEKYLSDPPSSGLRSENHGKLKGYLEKYLKSSQGQDATPAILQAPKKVRQCQVRSLRTSLLKLLGA